MVNPTKATRPFEVSADGRGMTGRAGLSPVGQRHMKVLEGQPELLGDIASAATANRTIIALADRER